MMDYAEIKQYVNMSHLIDRYGIELRNGRCACPIHKGSNKNSFAVHSNYQAWTCHSDCDCSGDIFGFVEKMDGVSNSQSRMLIMEWFGLGETEQRRKQSKKKTKSPVKQKVVNTYRDTNGDELFKTIRIEREDGSKDFYPEYKGQSTLPKEVRTLYNLPGILGNTDDYICLCEGEKTARALMDCGFIGTTNPFGSKNWDAAYADILTGQKIVILPDADEHGEKWRDQVIESLCGKVESVQVVNIPDEFIADHPEFSGHDFADYVSVHGEVKASGMLLDGIESAQIMPNGVDPELLGRPVDTWREIRKRAKKGISTTLFNLKEWLPSLDLNVKQGDLIVLMANTSTGKTRILHNLPFHLRNLNFVVFDLELSKETLALRYAALENNMSMQRLETRLEHKQSLNDVTVDNVFIQKIEKLSVAKIKERVELIERATGRTMHGIAVDYIGLMSGVGSLYESTSSNVEEFKAYIGNSNKFGILTTQVSRPDNKDDGMFKCPTPFSAKNSGSIECSAQTLIGFWKEKDKKKQLWARVLKYTHGMAPQKNIPIKAEDLLMTEGVIDE